MSPATQQTAEHSSGLSAALYAASVAVTSAIVSFLIVVVTGPLFSDGETWTGFALAWFFYGLPALLVASASTIAVYGTYRRATSQIGRAACYLGCVVLAGAAGIGLSIAVGL